MTSLRPALLALALGPCLLSACGGNGAGAPATASATDPGATTTVVFSGPPVDFTATPIVDQTITVGFTVADHTSSATTVSGMPYALLVDGVTVATGVTAPIAPSGTATTTANLKIPTAGQHTLSVALDPDNLTGVVNQAANTQSITIVVAAAAAAG